LSFIIFTSDMPLGTEMLKNAQRISPEFEHMLLFQYFQFFWELTNQ
jgi:hypothetical protein